MGFLQNLVVTNTSVEPGLFGIEQARFNAFFVALSPETSGIKEKYRQESKGLTRGLTRWRQR
ncbi:MAG: hypothetical protein DRP66_11850 [Planctomycetota bacterium]|nr:MAG: hypothetical protein DRP66_11850 [Planctomycetota bacterium]